MKKFLVISVSLAVITTIYFLSYNGSKENKTEPTLTDSTKEKPSVSQEAFALPKKSAHYESNTPDHAATLVAPPLNVVVNFNFDLASDSSLKINKDGRDWGVGGPTIDSNQLTLRRKINPDSPDGVYSVSYQACWPDGNCHDGNFQFKIDHNQAAAYEDLRDQPEIRINLADVSFQPKNVRINSGTKVTWVNQDQAIHYVNSDSHPAHSYFPEQNSKALKPGDTFSLVFDTPGVYPYHCSAHAASMSATISVD